jgi:hypothetical protein
MRKTNTTERNLKMDSNTSLASFLKPEEIAALQSRMMQILSEEILYYTNGKSSSVTAETAQSLLESMLYCITAYLNTLPEPHTALETRDLGELYQNGLVLIKQYIEDAKKLLKEVKATRVQTDLIAYNNTLDFAIDKILECYDPRFAAQYTTPLGKMAIIDYPLTKDDMSITGIIYIVNYLTQLKKENAFCAKYSKNHIRSLLFTYGAKYHLDHREMLVNIPEVILEHEKTGGSKDSPVEVPYYE